MTSLFEVDLSQNENGEDAWGIYNSTTNPDRSDYYSTISGEIIALKEKTDNSLNLFYYDINSSLKNSKNKFIAKNLNLTNNIFKFMNGIKCINTISQVNVVYSNGNKYVFNNSLISRLVE